MHFAAIRCVDTPAKPDSGSKLITSYGARYGPVCKELQTVPGPHGELGAVLGNSGNCQSVRTRITGIDGVTEWTISVISDKNPVDEVFLRIDMTSPPLQFMVE